MHPGVSASDHGGADAVHSAVAGGHGGAAGDSAANASRGAAGDAGGDGGSCRGDRYQVVNERVWSATGFVGKHEEVVIVGIDESGPIDVRFLIAIQEREHEGIEIIGVDEA